MKYRIFFIAAAGTVLAACQSVPPANQPEASESEVCIGDPVVVDNPNEPIDLEAMAKQVECP